MATEKQKQKIVEALMALCAERDFARIGLAEIAAGADVTLAQLRAAYDGKMAILADFARRIDAAVLAGDDPGMAGEPPRERLFDVVMRRFDALTPHKAGVAGLMKAARRDPLLAAALNRIALTSQRWMLTAAGLDRGGLSGLARAQALALAYAQVLPVWLEETDAGLPKTMAALDTQLKRLERAGTMLGRVESALCRLSGRRRPREASTAHPDGGAAEAAVPAAG
ncbi:TetR/AcrR family transcriptional regulator [Prosthecomicrobium hirschii]|uniref:TetR/AcrR family transcriptional regulator n=1 Tax=Prosthecodimorpha hirschii TaxID=665126 RepID=UPI0022203456|nr:TetR/AcrR family transcriptional regulator [Prosthecomicrobium hirschii]MCW1840722.1 TetR/AcrR family transcriptional regulator [Prosthecomicrobium hirschii]